MLRLPLFRGSTRSSSTSQHDSGKNVNNNHNKPRRRRSFADILLIPPYNDRHRQKQVDTAYSINRSVVRRTGEGTHHEHDNITTINNDHQLFRKKDPKLPAYDDNLDDIVDGNDNKIDSARYGTFISCLFPKRSRRIRKTRTKSKVATNNNVQQSPTNTLCGRTTVTDCRSRSSSSNNEESSPRDIHNMMSSGPLLTFRDIIRFNNSKSIDKVDLRCCDDGDNNDDKYDPDPDNHNDDTYECAYVHHRDQQDYRTEEESIKNIKNKEVQKNDDDHDHNLQELPIPRSEMIGKLFPMGYPNRLKPSEMIPSTDHHRQNLNSTITDESKITRTKPKPPISEKEKDEDYKATLISTSFGRSEIISSLFPMGHPNDIRKKQESGSNSSLIVKEEHTNNKQINFHSTPCRDINSSSLKVQYSPTFDTIATSSDFDHTQQGREEKVLAMTEPQKDYDSDPAECKETKEKSSDHDCDDNITGMVISFDPTWGLLTEETDPIDPTTSIMVRSRLKKFHEIENYADSLLGKISAEESSNDESIIVDMFAGLKSNHESELLLSSSSRKELMFSISDPILDLQSYKNHHNCHPMVVKEKNCVDNFELGFHFDSERYPSSVPSEEIEVCFYPDEETSIAYDVSEEKRSTKKHYIDSGKSEKNNRLDDDFGCVRNADQEQETSFDECTDCFEYESNNMHTPSTADTSVSLQPCNMLNREQLFHTDNLSFVQ
jgi:hypothetical protein